MIFGDENYWFSLLSSTETVLPHFHGLHSSVDWASNVCVESLNAILDCRGNFGKFNVSSSLEHVLYGIEFYTMGPFNWWWGSQWKLDTNSCLYLSSNPIEGCMWGTLYTGTESAMMNFFARASHFMIYKVFAGSLNEELIKQVFNIALKCKA